MSQKKGWGSLLTGAVAGLESRLDTILAEDSEASARARAAEQALKDAKGKQAGSGSLAPPPGGNSASGSGDASRSRVNDRLAERLAKATQQKPTSQTGSKVPSRVASPSVEDGKKSERASGEAARPVPESERAEDVKQDAAKSDEPTSLNGDVEKPDSAEKGDLTTSGLPINPAKVSIDTPRASSEVQQDESSTRPSSEQPTGTSQPAKDAAELETELQRLQQEHAESEKQRKEEMNSHLERIDALQAKLQYLAKDSVAAAKEANASAPSGTLEQQVAEKDERIALLIQEGEKLSKTEMRHLQTIKKLRAKTTEEDKATAGMRKKLERAERAEQDLKQKLRKAEMADRQANEKLKQIASIEKVVGELQTDRENASELIRKLTAQLRESERKAEQAQKEVNSRAAEADKGRIAGLENELEDAQIERKLAEDRAVAEAKRGKEETDRQRERSALAESELKNEIAGLESRLEAMRTRAEEASSEGAGGEGSVHLLRQVEMVQSQYSQAKENWETIEGSLNARLAALEKERDEGAKRETEVRRKARDVGGRCRKAEEEVESVREDVRRLEAELSAKSDQARSMQERLGQAEATERDAKADVERQRKVWETELAQRLEEEKAKWRRQAPTLRTESPAIYSRKASTQDPVHLPPRWQHRSSSTRLNPPQDSSPSEIRPNSSYSRRGSTLPTPTNPNFPSTPGLSRQESCQSLSTHTPNEGPPTPSVDAEADNFGTSTPPLPLDELVSTTTSGAGPSVQLVERLSTAVRRLESEKAATRDELSRLSSQRDQARDEVVALMREVEASRETGKKVEGLEKELAETKRRYEASLEMLGEREEQVEELKGDIGEMKRLYRELVEKVGK
ncbi:hypothetical protein MBLNU230_g1053t1 [Neophaeotheca triangularis]